MPTPLVREVVGATGENTATTATTSDAVRVGDVIVAFHGTEWGSQTAMGSITGAGGTWAERTVDNRTAGTSHAHLKTWSSVVTADGVQTVTTPRPAGGAETTLTLVVLDGTTVNPSDWLDAAAGGGSGALTSANAVTAHVAPGVDPVTTDALLLCAFVAASGTPAPTYTGPSGMTVLDTRTTPYARMSVYRQTLASGAATGDKTATASAARLAATATVAIKGVAPPVATVLAVAEEGEDTTAPAVAGVAVLEVAEEGEDTAAPSVSSVPVLDVAEEGEDTPVPVVVPTLLVAEEAEDTPAPTVVAGGLSWSANLDATTLAGMGFSLWQRQTDTTGTFTNSSTLMPPKVSGHGGRPGTSLQITLSDTERRNEVVPNHRDLTTGDSVYFAQAFYLAPGFPLDPTAGFDGYQIIDQIHQAWGNYSPPISFEALEGQLRITGGYGLSRAPQLGGTEATDPTTYQYAQSLAPLQTGQWYGLVYYIQNFSQVPGASKLSVWLNGTPLLTNWTIPPPTLVQGDAAGIESYRKVGIYHSDALPAATIYQAEHAAGQTYAEVDPGVGAAPTVPTLPTGTDAYQRAVLGELRPWAQWLLDNGAQGYVGEFGGVTLMRSYNQDAEQAKWDALANVYMDACATLGFWTTPWASGREWGFGYPLGLVVGQNVGGALTSAHTGWSYAYETRTSSGTVRRGTNLSGWEHGASITGGMAQRTGDGYPHTAADFNALRLYGVDTVRLPLPWERLQTTRQAALSTTALATLDAQLQAAAANGIKVILDLHCYARYTDADGTVKVLGGDPSAGATGTLTNGDLYNFWALMSAWVKANTTRNTTVIAFDLVNEPHAMIGGAAAWEFTSNLIVGLLRGAGETRTLIVEGYQFASMTAWPTVHPDGWIDDPADNFLYSAHHYWDTQTAPEFGPRSGTYQQTTTGPILTYEQERAARAVAEAGNVVTLDVADEGEDTAAPTVIAEAPPVVYFPTGLAADFSTALNATDWPVGSRSAGVTVSGGTLNIPASFAGGPQYNFVATRTESFTGKALVFRVANLPSGNANAQMWVQDSTPANTVDRLGFEYVGAADRMDFIGQTGPTYAPIGTTVSVTGWKALGHSWFLLDFTPGGALAWWTSADGLQWLFRRTILAGAVPAWVSTADCRADFEAFRLAAGVNDTFQIDSVNVLPAAPQTIAVPVADEVEDTPGLLGVITTELPGAAEEAEDTPEPVSAGVLSVGPADEVEDSPALTLTWIATTAVAEEAEDSPVQTSVSATELGIADEEEDAPEIVPFGAILIDDPAEELEDAPPVTLTWVATLGGFTATGGGGFGTGAFGTMPFGQGGGASEATGGADEAEDSPAPGIEWIATLGGAAEEAEDAPQVWYPTLLEVADEGEDSTPPDQATPFRRSYVPGFRNDRGMRVLAQQIRPNLRMLDLELPVADLSITKRLSQPQSITGFLSPHMPRVAELAIRPWNTYLHVEDDYGFIRASGILAAPFGVEDDRRSLECVGVSTMPHQTVYEGAYSQFAVDPMAVIRHLWAHVQSFPDANLGVAISQNTTPVRIGGAPPSATSGLVGPRVDDSAGSTDEVKPFEINWWDQSNCGEVLEKLLRAVPIDYIEREQWNADFTGITHRVDYGYPRVGTRRTDLRFAGGENIIGAVPIAELDDAYITDVRITGAGEGSAMVLGSASRRGQQIRRVSQINEKTVTSTARAKAIADAELLRRAEPRGIDTLLIDAHHENAAYGSFMEGDDILVQTEVDWIGEISMWHRVMESTYTPDQGAVALKLRPSSTFRYGADA